ncbi:hypothetical protein ABE10_03155 [Bacillus toyonensis]|nr:hypothetical protein [Bacillus toyonensis]
MPAGRQAPPGLEVPLPVVHAAGEHAVLIDLPGAREVGAEVRAPPLHDPVADLRVLSLVRLLLVPVLDVLDPVCREALEERRQELVELAAPADLELHGQEDRVGPVDLAVTDVRGDKVGRDRVPVDALLSRILPDLRAREVDDHVELADAEPDAPAYAEPDGARLLQQRLPPGLERRKDLLRRERLGTGGLFVAQLLLPARPLLLEVVPLLIEDVRDLGLGVERLRGGHLAALDRHHRARDEQLAVVLRRELPHVLEELLLIGENGLAVASDAVEVEEVVSQEHRRTRHGEDVRGVDLLDVVHGALVLRLTLEPREVLLGVQREVIDHGPPDRAGNLGEIGVRLAEVQKLLKVERVRVVLVQHRSRAVVDAQRRVADRTVAGCAERRDHDLQLAALDHLARRCICDVRIAERADVLLELVGRVLREQHLDVLADVPIEQPRVEVVAMAVRDVEEVRFTTEPLPVEPAVVGKGEPGSEEGRTEHRVADDVAADRLDEHPGVSESRDPHVSPPAVDPSSLPAPSGDPLETARG